MLACGGAVMHKRMAGLVVTPLSSASCTVHCGNVGVALETRGGVRQYEY